MNVFLTILHVFYRFFFIISSHCQKSVLLLGRSIPLSNTSKSVICRFCFYAANNSKFCHLASVGIVIVSSIWHQTVIHRDADNTIFRAFFNISLSGLGTASQSLQYMTERFLGETSRVSLLKLALSVSSMACLLQPYLLLSLSPVLRKNIGKSLNLHNHSEPFYTNNRYPKLLPREQAPGVISVPQFLDKDRHEEKRKLKCKGKPSTSRISVEVSRCQLTKNSEFDSRENLYERGHHYTDSRGRQITVFPPEWLSINGSDFQYNETTNNRTKSICFLIQQYQSNKYDFKRRKTLAEIPTSYANDVGRSEV